VCSAFFPIFSSPLRAQQPKPNNSLTDTPKRGPANFPATVRRLPHASTIVARRYGPALYKEIVEDNEDTIRDTILEGREALMPGFKYGLTRPAIDSIIEVSKDSEAVVSPPRGCSGLSTGLIVLGGETAASLSLDTQ